MERTENQKIYFVGLDIGTNSVGYAVTDENYALCKYKGKACWGSALFDTALLNTERRAFRTGRRRLDRRQQRVALVSELFAKEITALDPNFFIRRQQSWMHPKETGSKNHLFDGFLDDRTYYTRYPTVHHLICELMQDPSPHDVRLVFIACAWLVAHRGHFLWEIRKDHQEEILNFAKLYDDFTKFIRDNGYSVPWSETVSAKEIGDKLKEPIQITRKSKELCAILFPGCKKAPEASEEFPFGCNETIKLLCGGTVKIADLFRKESYAALQSGSLQMEDEKFVALLAELDADAPDADYLRQLKAMYDWSVLADVLQDYKTISEAKVAVYNQHKTDLAFLKHFVRTYMPEKYQEVFRDRSVEGNYAAYSGNAQKSADKEAFCKYIAKLVKAITPDKLAEEDKKPFQSMLDRLQSNAFMPKQRESDNRVIPYQLYWHELNQILEQACGYLPFLRDRDEDGITVQDKLWVNPKFCVNVS